MQKYIDALDRILGVDHAYYSGDKDVDTILELISTSREMYEIIQMQRDVLELQNAILKEERTNKTLIDMFALELMRYPHNSVPKREIRRLYNLRVGVTNA